jgi:alpha-ketoglutarate-dependent taurine dioxygenase
MSVELVHEHDTENAGSDLTLTPWTPVLGTRVSGYRYDGVSVPAEIQTTLKNALFNSGVLIFDPGVVTGANFTDFVRFLGEPLSYDGPHTPRAEDNPAATIVDSTHDKFLRNHIWHADGTFKPQPPAFTALYAKQVPKIGGDTVFSNVTVAYERFDAPFRAYLDSLYAVTYVDATGHLADRYLDAEKAAAQRAELAPITRPLIETHPETGRKWISANESYTSYIKGVSRIVSQNILGILFDAIKASEVTGRVSWEEGAFVVWDNRVVQHKGIKDYSEERRLLYRITLV